MYLLFKLGKMGRIASMRTTKSKKDKYNGNKKERMASTKEDEEGNPELEEELDRIRHLPSDEFNKMFEKMLVSINS